MTQRYALTIEYEGTCYYGWQRQDNAGLKTIQSEIEKAIKAFSGQDITIQCAGRTDAGVHAWGQIAHMDLADLKRPMQPFEIVKAINAHLRPQPISIVEAQPVADDFHARFNAKNKLYIYRILNRQAFLALEQGRMWLIRKPLDTDAMNEAAKILLGQHDFTTFRSAHCQSESPIKTIDEVKITHSDENIYFGISAKSFLHHQVRSLVGSLKMVGDGSWSIHDFDNALKSKNRSKCGALAPSEGLYFMEVKY